MILHQSLRFEDVLHPTEQDMVNAIGSLMESGAEAVHGYVILADGKEQGQQVYGPGVIQVLGVPDHWIVEYRDRVSGKWYRSPRGLPKARIMALFHAFYRGDASLMNAVSWTESTGGQEGETPVVQILVWLLLTAMVVSVAFWKL